MGKPYSQDLRERVIAALIRELARMWPRRCFESASPISTRL